MNPERFSNGWWKVILQGGPVAAIAFFLLAQSAGYVPSINTQIKDVVAAHVAEATVTLEAARQVAVALDHSQAEIIRLLQIQCLRSAQSDVDRQACVQGVRR